ncbi:MAG TPA: periplasmic heavy metal sensor [Methylomirabilota bacterium]|nr:periplasmic heavy metal sensor [Methylomirabilota bacterium]
MLSRRTILGSVAVLGVGLAATVAAFAHGGPGGRHGMFMKRFVSSMIDEALEPAKVTADQRAKIYAARDRAFAAVETHRQTRRAHMDEALRLFEADVVDAGQVAVFRAQRETEHRQVADAISQAVTEVHDVLTPVQRKAVADWVRAHRPGH